ncbi:hypothetical protein PTTG_05047 [Puccinia triticina 1-1 BBBD Race 1]|uniref:AMP-dependent synthetase/ligase domain-containing protein n=1 Tax=Puccinia triticina (isolate 1-1 / race 1 (BBBD)) TaxID=630390 RepID=A0A0C4EW57_PUCT1|nr:hypothetical protein PTTG_05047 [Puccinia triticina 1-1 BBBD Race 1]
MFLSTTPMVMTTLLLNNMYLTSILGAVPPPGFAQNLAAQAAPDSELAIMHASDVMNSTGMPMNTTAMSGNSSDSSQLNAGGLFPGLPSIFPKPTNGSSGNQPKFPLPFPNPFPNVTPSVNQSCVAGIKSLITASQESEGQPMMAREKVSCFKPYTKVPEGESLVVASVDAATNVTASLAQLVQDVSGKGITAAIPVIISDLRTLTAVVATGVAHIAVSPFNSRVITCQALLDTYLTRPLF